MVFKIFIVKFLNNYPKMKKCSLSLHFLQNNFLIIKEICHENASEFKQHFLSKYFYVKKINI